MESKRIEILDKIGEAYVKIKANDSTIWSIKDDTKVINSQIRLLKAELSPICIHEFGDKYKQRVTPSKEVYARSCNFCDLQLYESELPKNAVIKIRPIIF